MTTPLPRDMFAALLDELAVVIGGAIDSPAAVVPASPLAGRQWVTRIAVEGSLTGTLAVALDAAGVLTLTRVLTGVEGDIADEVLLDTIREVMAQAVSATAQRPVARGASLAVVEVAPGEDLAADGEWSAHAIGAQKLPVAIEVMTSGTLAAGQAGAARASALRAVPPPAGAAAKGAEAGSAVMDERMDVILDIDLPLVVRFGRTELPLKALTRLGPGSVIDLGRSPDDPVEVLVSNRVVARGEVVIVSGSYGIRILDVVSPRERVRSMEA